MYVRYLANIHSAPSSVRNYLSGAKIWVAEHLGNVTSFFASEVDTMIKSVIKNSDHIMVRAFPLSLSHVKDICNFLDLSVSVPPAIKPCILIGYACYLRASNIVSAPSLILGGRHSILVRDIIVHDTHLVVTVKSTKTLSTPVTVAVSADPDPVLCPVLAWRQYLDIVRPSYYSPAFCLSNGIPLSADLVVQFMRTALTGVPDVDISRVSLHSLRRGAAQNAASAGIPLTEIMHRGTWKSKSGVRPYLID